MSSRRVLTLVAGLVAGCVHTHPAPHAEAPARSRAVESTCSYEENCDCPVPGVTIRWQMAYCMALNATDDEVSPPVVECMEREGHSESSCEANAAWKRRICGLTAARHGRSSDACERDPEFLPYPVPRGVGG